MKDLTSEEPVTLVYDVGLNSLYHLGEKNYKISARDWLRFLGIHSNELLLLHPYDLHLSMPVLLCYYWKMNGNGYPEDMQRPPDNMYTFEERNVDGHERLFWTRCQDGLYQVNAVGGFIPGIVGSHSQFDTLFLPLVCVANGPHASDIPYPKHVNIIPHIRTDDDISTTYFAWFAVPEALSNSNCHVDWSRMPSMVLG